MKRNISLDHISTLVGKNYDRLQECAMGIRVILIFPLLALCMIYSSFLQVPKGEGSLFILGFGVHPWGFIISACTSLYCLSILIDIFVALFKPDLLKYPLSNVPRYFRITTYFFAGTTVANFTYRSYSAVGLDLPLHLLLFSTMLLIVTLIFFHAYQCKEGLAHGGKHSEKPSW